MATRNVLWRLATQATLSASSVAQYGLQTVTFAPGYTFTDPADDAEVSVVATFTKPGGGTISVIGYYDAPQAMSFSGGYLMFSASGSPAWHIRFTPTIVGTYTGVITVTTRDHGVHQFTIPSFACTASADHGFLKLAPSGLFTQLSDGAFFFPVGQYLALTWDQQGTWNSAISTEAEQVMRTVAAAGGNAVRAFSGLSTRAALRWTNPSNYTFTVFPGHLGMAINQLSAANLDQWIALADELKIYSNVVLGAAAAFDDTLAPGYFAWSQNPYNSANGGPASSQLDFYTNATAKRLYKQELRYAIARWGYSPRISHFELMQEWDWNFINKSAASGTAARDALIAAAKSWATEMVSYIKSIDPYHHLVTVSGATPHGYMSDPSNLKYNGMFTVGDFDTAEYHLYCDQGSGDQTVTARVKTILQDVNTAIAKPLGMGEFGITINTDGAADEADTAGIGIHNAMWVAMTQGSGIMPWYVLAVKTGHNLPHIAPLQAFLSGEDFEADYGALSAVTRRVAVTASNSLFAVGIGSATKALIWVQNPASVQSSAAPSTTSGATVTITGLTAGTYNVTQWDTYAGTHGSTSQIVATTSLVVPLADFTRDVAIKVVKQ